MVQIDRFFYICILNCAEMFVYGIHVRTNSRIVLYFFPRAEKRRITCEFYNRIARYVYCGKIISNSLRDSGIIKRIDFLISKS